MGILNSVHKAGILGVASLAPFLLRGQIVTDGTLGPRQSLNNPFQLIPESLGTTRGGNLFHSFSDFNVNTGQIVEFTGPSTIERVFTRVTGGGVSKIEGNLNCSIPGADFYLINPAGILFGKKSVVDVKGSFTATTADALTMADGSRFQAKPGAADEILSVAPPASFGFLDPGPTAKGQIQFQAGTTEISTEGRTDLVAQSFEFGEGAFVSVPYGAVRMVAVGGAAELPLEALTAGDLPTRGDIEFKSDSRLEVGVDGAATLQLEAGNLRMKGAASPIVGMASIQIEANESTSVAENTLRLRGILDMDHASIEVTSNGEDPAIPLHIVANEISLQHATIGVINASDAPGGELKMETGNLRVVDSSRLYTEANGQGKGGDIRIQGENVHLDDASIAAESSDSDVDEPGAAGSITLRAKSLNLLKGKIHSKAGGPSGGGDIWIDAPSIRLGGGSGLAMISTEPLVADSIAMESPVHTGDIHLSGDTLQLLANSHVSSSSEVGPAGSVFLSGRTIYMESGASVDTSSWGSSNGGSIRLRASETLQMNNARLSSSAEDVGGTGAQSGNIVLTAGNEIGIFGGSTIASESFGYSDAGNILIQAPIVRMDSNETGGPNISTDVFPVLKDGQIPSKASGGGIQVIAEKITLNSVNVSSGITDAGVGGSIRLKAPVIQLRNSLVSAEADHGGQGGSVFIEGDDVSMLGGWVSAEAWDNISGGDIQIRANDLHLAQGARVSSTVYGNSAADAKSSSITIRAEHVRIEERASIEAATEGNVRGGDIDIVANDVRMEKSQISAGSGGAGRSGNVTINTRSLVLLKDALIDTDTWNVGDGGNIDIHSDSLWIGTGAGISAEALGNGQLNAVAGSIRISADQVDLAEGATISATTSHDSSGGDIRIAANVLQLSGRTAEASISTATYGAGNGGLVRVEADQIQLRGAEAEITARSFGFNAAPGESGRAGSIELMARNISMDLDASVSSSSRLSDAGSVRATATGILQTTSGSFVVDAAKGNAGSVVLASGSLLLLKDALILASADGTGGNIQLNAPAVGLEGSDLLANAVNGDGGSISITSDLYFTRDPVSILFDSRNESARTGSFTLNSSLDLLGSLQPLNVELVEDSARIRDGCSRRNPRANTLLVRGKGGVSSGAGGFVSAVSLWNP